MSKLYGTLVNERNGRNTRCAHRQISASAQSWEGSVTVTISIDTDGMHWVNISSTPDSGQGGRMLFHGALELLVRAERLSVVGTRGEGALTR